MPPRSRLRSIRPARIRAALLAAGGRLAVAAEALGVPARSLAWALAPGRYLESLGREAEALRGGPLRRGRPAVDVPDEVLSAVAGGKISARAAARSDGVSDSTIREKIRQKS